MRRELAEELALWLAGEETDYQAGRIAGLARAISRNPYEGPGATDEIERALLAAHSLNARFGRPCGCGRRGCSPRTPVPLGPGDDIRDAIIAPRLDVEARRIGGLLPPARRGPTGLPEIDGGGE